MFNHSFFTFYVHDIFDFNGDKNNYRLRFRLKNTSVIDNIVYSNHKRNTKKNVKTFKLYQTFKDFYVKNKSN